MTPIAKREVPDIETASEGYARRFAGPAGRRLLAQQDEALKTVLDGWDGRTILDVGGGHAQLLPILTAIGERVVVVGSDPAAFARIRSDFPRCGMVAGDLLNLPFRDESFDLVTAVRLISHIVEWRRLVSELCRVSRQTVVIDFPRSAGLNALTPLLFPVKRRMEGNTRPYRSFSDSELDATFANCSFITTSRHAQFFLPMVVHRRLGAAAFPQRFEHKARSLKLTHRWGSPVMLRADRTPRA